MSSENVRKAIGKYTYYLSDKIGSGYSSNVYSGKHQLTNVLVAIKIMPKKGQVSHDQIDLAKVQIKALQQLRNLSYILQIKDYIQTKNNLYIITELCSEGPLHSIIRKNKKLQQQKAIIYIKQILKGLQYLKINNIVHRDIKPLNIFVKQNGQVRIGDFGFSIKMASGQNFQIEDNSGSPFYMPLESLLNHKFSFQSDMWAVGITFYEMLTGKLPWKAKSQKELMEELKQFDPTSLNLKHFSHKSRQFIHKTLQNQQNRLKFLQFYTFFNSDEQQSPSFYKPRLNLQKMNQSNGQMKAIGKESLVKINRPQTDRAKQSLITAQNQVYKQPKRLKIETQRAIKPKNPIERDLMVQKKTKESSNVTASTEHTQTSLIIKKQHKKPRQITHQLMDLIESQVQYFKFLFQLFQIVHLALKTQDPQIQEFKQNLMYLCFKTIQEISQLRHCKHISPQQMQLLKEGKEFKGVLTLLNKYKEKYYSCLQKYHIKINYKSKDSFEKLIDFVEGVMYSNLVQAEDNVERLAKRHNLIVIFNELKSLRKLMNLQELKDWFSFHQKAQISKIDPKERSNEEVLQLWKKTKQIYLNNERK